MNYSAGFGWFAAECWFLAMLFGHFWVVKRGWKCCQKVNLGGCSRTRLRSSGRGSSTEVPFVAAVVVDRAHGGSNWQGTGGVGDEVGYGVGVLRVVGVEVGAHGRREVLVGDVGPVSDDDYIGYAPIVEGRQARQNAGSGAHSSPPRVTKTCIFPMVAPGSDSALLRRICRCARVQFVNQSNRLRGAYSGRISHPRWREGHRGAD